MLPTVRIKTLVTSGRKVGAWMYCLNCGCADVRGWGKAVPRIEATDQRADRWVVAEHTYQQHAREEQRGQDGMVGGSRPTTTSLGWRRIGLPRELDLGLLEHAAGYGLTVRYQGARPTGSAHCGHRVRRDRALDRGLSKLRPPMRRSPPLPSHRTEQDLVSSRDNTPSLDFQGDCGD